MGPREVIGRPDGAAPADEHVIVAGIDHLGLRTIEELRRRDEQVVAIAPEGAGAPPDATTAALTGVPLVRGDARSEATLRAAGITTATAIVFTADDDLGNVHAALAAQELRPGVRIVVRLFDQELGSHLGELVTNAVALSSSALAAPGFVSAALDGESGGQFELGGRRLTPRSSDAGAAPPDARRETFAIARLRADRSVEVLPDADPAEPGLIVVDAVAADPTDDADDLAPVGVWTPARLVRGVTDAPVALRERLTSPDRRLVNLALVLLVLAGVSALYFEVVAGLTPLDAVSYAVTLLTGASGGGVDIDPANSAFALKVYGIGLSLLGAALIGVVYALITDAIIGSRLLRLLGRRPIPRRIRNHVIVCGLGSIGYRVALGLVARGVRVVAVEANESGRFVSAARSLGIPVLTGDARQPEILGELRIGTARALVAATDNDLVNLAAALNARAVRPDLRVVVRLFDPDFALRVQRGLRIRFTRSVSHLAAPAFAAAVYGSDLAAAVPIGDRRVVLFARVPVLAGAALEGTTIGAMSAPGQVRVLAVRRGDGHADSGGVAWRPDPGTPLAGGMELYVAATRDGLAGVMQGATIQSASGVAGA